MMAQVGRVGVVCQVNTLRLAAPDDRMRRTTKVLAVLVGHHCQHACQQIGNAKQRAAQPSAGE